MNIKSAMTVGKKAATTVLGLLFQAREPKQLRGIELPRETIVAPERAQWCFVCRCTSDATGDICPACQEKGTLLSLSRLLLPNPRTGRIDFVCAEENNA
jgi:hypothetical protein